MRDLCIFNDCWCLRAPRHLGDRSSGGRCAHAFTQSARRIDATSRRRTTNKTPFSHRCALHLSSSDLSSGTRTEQNLATPGAERVVHSHCHHCVEGPCRELSECGAPRARRWPPSLGSWFRHPCAAPQIRGDQNLGPRLGGHCREMRCVRWRVCGVRGMCGVRVRGLGCFGAFRVRFGGSGESTL